MKRSWIGGGILAALLVVALLVTWGMDRIHRPVTASLESAREAALAGQWEQAEEAAAAARQSWDKWEHFRGCFADHTPTEEIDSCFAQLAVLAAAGESSDFAALAAETARRVEAISQSHALTWQNLF